MRRAPVSAVLITRDDAGLEAALRSVSSHVEEVILLDTCPGKTSCNTSWLLGSVRSYYFEACNDENGKMADFSAARNYAYSLATQPWVLWLDADDVVANAEMLPEVVRRADKARDGRPCRVLFPYEYAYDEDGDVSILQGRERLSTRGDFEWRRPVHEGLVPKAGVMPRDVLEESSLVWKHRRQYLKQPEGRDDGRNERILRRLLDRGAASVRDHLDLGVELSIRAQGEKDSARRTEIDDEARSHLLLASGDPGARLALVQLELREAYARVLEKEERFDPTDAREHAFAAMALRPAWDRPSIEAGKIAYVSASAWHASPRQERLALEEAVLYLEEGLRKKPAPFPTQREPLERALRANQMLADCYHRLGDPKVALEYVAAALEAKPRSANLIQQQKTLEAEVLRTRIAADLRKLHAVDGIGEASYEMAREAVEEPRVLRDRILAVGHYAAYDAGLKDVDYLVERRQRRGALSVVFACGSTVANWDPDVIAKGGAGGSEIAVVEMAKRLAGEGCGVRVYANVGEEMVRDGVEYLRAGKLWLSSPCDVLVAWRNAALLEPEIGPLRVGARALWCHDVEPTGATPERMLLADRVFAVSEWHRRRLMEAHGLPAAKCVRMRNGFNLSELVELVESGREVERDPKKAVWFNSPDRGLKNLLEMWPTIRERVEGAELHVFYGFDGWKKVAAYTRDPVLGAWCGELEALVDSMAGQGVRKRGRIPPDELAEELLSAGCWLYPTKAEETSCVAAFEAQLAGLAVVTSQFAALPEAVANGVLVAGDPETPEYRAEFVEHAVACMTDDQFAATKRAHASATALRTFARDGLEREWLGVFREMLEEAEGGTMPEFVPAVAEPSYRKEPEAHSGETEAAE